MLYNDSITYNQINIPYNGAVVINVQGIQNPIILNNVNVLFNITEDYSNGTTTGIMTIDYVSTGTITIDILNDQIATISQSIESAQVSGILTIDLNTDQAALISQSITPTSESGEITIEVI